MAHATSLSEWDRHILRNRSALLSVEEELRRVDVGQGALERKLGLIETHQKVRRKLVIGIYW